MFVVGVDVGVCNVCGFGWRCVCLHVLSGVYGERLYIVGVCVWRCRWVCVDVFVGVSVGVDCRCVCLEV